MSTRCSAHAVCAAHAHCRGASSAAADFTLAYVYIYIYTSVYVHFYVYIYIYVLRRIIHWTLMATHIMSPVLRRKHRCATYDVFFLF